MPNGRSWRASGAVRYVFSPSDCLQLVPYGEYFLMGSGVAKGHAARGVTPLRLSIKACPSAVRVVCREVETCPCEGLAVQPLQWPQAFRWDRLERRLPLRSDCCAPTIGRLSGCLASLVAPPSHLCVEAREEILAWHVASNIFDLPF